MKRLFYIFLSLSLVSCAVKKTTAIDSNEAEQIKTNKSYTENKISDSIQGQLKTAEKLRLLMDEKKYSEAILLFSKRQQENIAEIQKDEAMFNYWCSVWTFDDAKYKRYKNRIKSGDGIFVFEDNDWKIDER